jgi:hypothetical protein
VGGLQFGNGQFSKDLNITLPGNLGTWVVKAVAVAETEATGVSSMFGTAKVEVVARKLLNLLPSMPRVVRPRDDFFGGCTVTSLVDGVQVVVTASVVGGMLEMTEGSTRTVQVKADDPLEVLFRFKSGGVGEANVTFTATVVSGVTGDDAFTYALPLLGSQDTVELATSFTVEATPSTKGAVWHEGISFPLAVNGSGTVLVSSSVGHLAAVENIGKSINMVLQDELDRQGWAWTGTLLASLEPALPLHAFSQPEGAAVKAMAASLVTLISYTVEGAGLQMMPPSQMNYPPYPSTYPNWASDCLSRDMFNCLIATPLLLV